MNIKGMFRAWLVVATVAGTFLAVRDFNSQSRTWRQMDFAWVDHCTRQQFDSPDHPDSLACIRRMGADKTFFQHENTTPLAYWIKGLAIWLAVVIAGTIVLIGATYVFRWVVRGFNDRSSNNIEEWWGRSFEARGTITIESMPADLDVMVALKRLPTQDVAELFRSEGVHNHPSVRGLLAEHELRRRESWTARAALTVSILALLIAAIHR